MTPGPRRLVLPVVAALVTGACSAGSREAAGPADIDDGAATASSTSTPVVETLPPPPPTTEPPSDEPATMPDPVGQSFIRADSYVLPGGPGRIESRLGRAPILLAPGEYETDAMSTPMRFTLAEETRLIRELPHFMVLVDQSADEIWGVPIVHFIRPIALTDPAHTSDGPPDFPPTIDGWDLGEWLAAHPGIEWSLTDVEIGGVPAERFDLSFSSDGGVGWSADGERILPLFIDGRGFPFDLPSSHLARLWVIPQGEETPVVVHAAVDADDGWGDWGTDLDALMATIELGDPRPGPSAERRWERAIPGDVPAGTVHLPVLGGVRFELPADHFVFQVADYASIEVDAEHEFYPPDVEIAAAAETLDGAPIESADQLADLLVELGGVRLPDAELAGRRATVVELLGVQPGIPVFRHKVIPDVPAPDFFAWFTLDHVEVWAVDTDEGVLILTAEGEDPEGLDRARELHAAIAETLQVDVGPPGDVSG